MEPKPVIEGRIPTYPTRRDVLAGAAAFVLTALGGRWRIIAATEEGKIVVAPIFEHGPGRCYMGCMAVSPPVFLSEEEAMHVVREELGKHGVRLGKGITLKDTHISRRTVAYENGKERVGEIKDDIRTEADREAAAARDPAAAADLPGPLKLDGVDAAKRIGVKCVLHPIYSASGGVLWSSAEDYIEAARYVADTARRQSHEPIYLGVFYEPAPHAETLVWPDTEGLSEADADRAIAKAADEAMKKSKAKAGKLLREQVDDFVAWLKKQKAIK